MAVTVKIIRPSIAIDNLEKQNCIVFFLVLIYKFGYCIIIHLIKFIKLIHLINE